jgi:hypothetical protein
VLILIDLQDNHVYVSIPIDIRALSAAAFAERLCSSVVVRVWDTQVSIQVVADIALLGQVHTRPIATECAFTLDAEQAEESTALAFQLEEVDIVLQSTVVAALGLPDAPERRVPFA